MDKEKDECDLTVPEEYLKTCNRPNRMLEIINCSVNYKERGDQQIL